MQFSLKALMIAMLVAAILCAILFSFPRWLTTLLLFFVASLLPAVLVTTIVYGECEQRVFAIGAATTYLVMYLNPAFGNSPFRQLSGFRLHDGPLEFLLFLVLLCASGWISVRFRRWLLRRSTEVLN